MDRRELALRLARACYLKGSFVLRSGTEATTYFDKYQFESDPELLTAVCQELAPLVPPDIEVLAGLELGGVPIAVRLSQMVGLPAAFVRKEAKTYGTARLAEGVAVTGKHVLIIEDVVSTGGQIALSTTELRAEGANVTTALCVVDRSGGRTPRLDDCRLGLISAFVAEELEGLETIIDPPASAADAV